MPAIVSPAVPHRMSRDGPARRHRPVASVAGRAGATGAVPRGGQATRPGGGQGARVATQSSAGRIRARFGGIFALDLTHSATGKPAIA